MLSREAEELLRILNADQPQHQVAVYLVAQARQRFSAAAVMYLRVTSEPEQLVLEASAGLPEAFSEVQVIGDPGSLLAWLDLTSVGVQWLDLRERDGGVTAVDGLEADAARAWLRSLGGHYAAMGVLPLMIGDEVSGALLLLYDELSVDGDALAIPAMQFAEQASLVAENAQLRRQAEQAAVLQERSRLARDLHDSVTQSLYSLTLLAEATRRLANGGDTDQVRVVAARLVEIGQQALKEMRLLVYQLRPSMLRRVGLSRALHQRLETVERRAGVDVLLTVDGDLEIPAVLEEHLYFLAQEALNNALKHASATAVLVRISVTDERLCLEIADDGVGFDVDQVASEGGFGLSSMRERAERLGGQLEIDSALGRGTVVVLTLDRPFWARGGSL